MRAIACGLVVALALGAPAQADRRIEHVLYNPEHIVTVHGKSGLETMIEFASDEHVENIAVGDSAAWQVTPNKRINLLFLKPLMARAHSNMTVITDRHRYLFDLVASGGQGHAVYALRFEYPEQLLITPVVNPEPAPPAPVTAPPPPPVRNTGWRATGDRHLIPGEVFDDGSATHIVWNHDSDLPAIFAPGPDGSEGPVNFIMKDGTIIIDGVAPRYVLRIGKASAILTRQSEAAR